jgi:uncharacterized membrane protein
LHLVLLLLWIVLGAGLRFTLLDSKPPWNDELATLVFSLGNSLRSLPLNQPIALTTLLAPLQPNPANTIGDVIHRLMTESTHPPVYFVLTHLWLKLFPTDAGLYHGLVSVWAARSLSALFGVAAIPAMFGLGWLTFRSRWTGQAAAALMAVSPYGIYLAQEARHYTLAVLVMIASLSCWTIAIRSLTSTPLSSWLCFAWVGINSLGVAVHYFFGLVLGAEAIALAGLGAVAFRKRELLSPAWLRLYAVAIGTLGGVLVWIPAWRHVSDNQLTEWIYDQTFLTSWMSPIERLVGWTLTMVAVLPVEGVPTQIAIASGLVVLVYVGWLSRIALRGLTALSQPDRLSVQAIGGVGAAALGLILCLTYGLHADLTIAARYQFIYFPVLMVLVGGTVGLRFSVLHWTRSRLFWQGAVLLLLPLLGSLTVVNNFAYQKPDRPDQLVPIIRATSQVPVLIATAHQTHEQTRELMGLALEYRRQVEADLESTGLDRADHRTDLSQASSAEQPQFLLAHLEPNSNTAVEILQQTIARLPRPFDLWTVNFLPIVQPDLDTCALDLVDRPKMHGYDYRLYHCNAK